MTKRKRLAIAVAVTVGIFAGVAALVAIPGMLFGPPYGGVVVAFLAWAIAALIVGYDVYRALPRDKGGQ